MTKKLTFAQFKNKIKLYEKAFPQMERDTLTQAAAITRLNAQQYIKDNFKLRNTWTLRGIVYTPATKFHGAIVGASKRVWYMGMQEIGNTREVQYFATEYVRGGSNSNKIKPSLRLDKIKNTKYHFKNNREAMILVKQVKRGQLPFHIFAWGKLKNGVHGLFVIRKTGIKLLYYAEQKTIHTEDTHWLLQSGNKVLPKLPGFFFDKVKKHFS